MKIKVLIVDDNSDNLYLLKTIFEGQGWGVCQAANGKVALEMAQDQAPDLIVSDILMPAMDGYALCRQCKSDEKLKNIPFVFYTGTCTEPKDEKFAQDLGADRFVLKPKKPATLIKILIDLLKEKKEIMPGTEKPLSEEMEYFRRHNEILFGKLEKKMSDLEVANHELRTVEEQYRLSFENITDIIFMVDAGFNILSMTPSVEKLLGYKAEDLIGRPLPDLSSILPPQSMEKAINHLIRVCKGETIPSSIYEFIAKDGTRKIGEVSGSPIMRDGKISGVVAVSRDMTERRKSEDALRESEERFRILTESSPTAILLYQNDKWIYANQAATEIMGYSVQELLSMNFWNVVHPDDRQTVKERGKMRQQASPVTSRYEFRIVSKDGTVKWVDLSGATIVYNGSPAGIISVLEITERKKMEEALRESEKKYRLLADQIPVIVCLLNMDLQTIYVTPSIQAVLGFTQEERIRQTVDQQLMPESLELVLNTLAKELELEKEGHNDPDRKIMLELEYYHKDGSTRWTETIVSGIRDEQGAIIAIHGVLRDITDRKKAQEELQQMLDKLSKAMSTTIHVLAAAVEARDPYTAGHQTRAANLACAIAEEMGLPREKIDGIEMAGSIHDIGKLSVPAALLTKSSKLTHIEFSLIKEHAQKGYEMLKDVESPWPLSEMVHQHHERMDGSGYPRNLKDGEIMMEARILAVADVVEAMASHRPYRAARGVEAALDEIEKNSRILYDKDVTNACLRLFRKKGYHLPEMSA
ncbi:MAG: response regulator [Smithellaceae bacterium]